MLWAQARRPGIIRVDGDEVEPVRKRDVLGAIVSVLVDPGNPMRSVLRRSLWSVVERDARPSDRRIFEAVVAGAHRAPTRA